MNVLLLRAPTPAPDRYESALREVSFTPQSLPVLETSLLLSGLKNILRKRLDVDGVIVTSRRSAEAWGRAVDEVLDSGEGTFVEAYAYRKRVERYSTVQSTFNLRRVGTLSRFMLSGLPQPPCSPHLRGLLLLMHARLYAHPMSEGRIQERLRSSRASLYLISPNLRAYCTLPGTRIAIRYPI